MNIIEFQKYCLLKKGAHEDFPFGDDTMVMKVMGKIFAMANLDGPLSLNLKCDPEMAVELRERYQAVRPGYHMNKKHWNTVEIDDSVTDALIRQWIDHSYNLVVSQLPAKLRKNL